MDLVKLLPGVSVEKVTGPAMPLLTSPLIPAPWEGTVSRRRPGDIFVEVQAAGFLRHQPLYNYQYFLPHLLSPVSLIFNCLFEAVSRDYFNLLHPP